MQFKNPINGHIEEKSVPWLWTALWCPFYLLYAGLWAPFFIWLLVGVTFFAALGPPATLFMWIVNILYAAVAGGMVRASYLRKGWSEVGEGPAPSTLDFSFKEKRFEPTSVSKMSATADKTCPFCAETIKAAAIVCRFCGKDLPQGVSSGPAAPIVPADLSTSDGCVKALVNRGMTVIQKGPETWEIASANGVTLYARSVDELRVQAERLVRALGGGDSRTLGTEHV